MQRLKSLNQIYQKRLIRPEYAHHQATPYACSLDSTLFNTDGSIKVPKSGDTTPLGTRTADAYTSSNSLVPGLVMVRTTGEAVTVGTGVAGASLAAAEQPFGLLANWVGGDFDDIGPQNVGSGVVGVWQGPDSTFTILAPGYDDTGLAAAVTASASGGANPGAQILLYAGADGRLKYLSSPSFRVPVARLIDRTGASTSSRIIVQLIV